AVGAAVAVGAGAGAGPEPLAPPRSGTSLTLQELAASCALEPGDLKDLERFGLIASRTVGGTAYYDDDALAAAHVAAGFMKFGVEARHLRMYKTAAEREAGFFEQVVMPMLKQRNPEARRQASETLAELARLGQQLRSTMLRNALRDYLEE
ncbi:MAG: MerR family transcriptional regulator, partial [Acidimicrobiia bacterium]|nr:MerR family transcriptional regulator [Acidimicrobiia bacterium]